MTAPATPPAAKRGRGRPALPGAPLPMLRGVPEAVRAAMQAEADARGVDLAVVHRDILTRWARRRPVR